MYRRSSTETIMYPIGQNIPLVHLQFGIAFFEPHQFLNSETVRLASFLIISFPLYGTSFRLPTGKCISSLHARYSYRNGYSLNLISTFLDSKYTGKTLHSDDLIRVVRNSCITYFHLTTLRLRTSTFYISTVEKAYGKTCPIPLVKSTVLLRISTDFLLYFAAILFSHPKNHIIFQIYGFQCYVSVVTKKDYLSFQMQGN